MKFYNGNGLIKKIISGATSIVLMTTSIGAAKASQQVEIVDLKTGTTHTITVPDNAKVKVYPDGGYEILLAEDTSLNVAATNDPDMAIESSLSYEDYIRLCDEQVAEIKSHAADIKRLQQENYRVENFEFNDERLYSFVKAYVYVTNMQYFSEDVRHQIISSNDISTDISILIGVDYKGFTDFVNAYNQTIVREQEIAGAFDKTKLISCEYSFGNETDRAEYVFAQETWFNSVKNGRVWNNDYYTLYCYLGAFGSTGLNKHFIQNASVGAQAGIYRTVGQDFKESYKVVFDNYMMDKENKNKFNLYFENTVTYVPRTDAKENILIEMNRINEHNTNVNEERELGDFTTNPMACTETLEELVYEYIHINDDINDFVPVVEILNQQFSNTKVKTR